MKIRILMVMDTHSNGYQQRKENEDTHSNGYG
jgi:hypothetical protein